MVGIGGGEYRSVQKKRRVEGGEWRVEGGEWRVEGEEVWSVQESGSEKILKKLSNVSKIFFTNFVSNLPNTILNSATSIYFAIIVSQNISQIFQNFISFY